MITIRHEILPFDKGQEYERPDADISKFVKLFPLGDFGVDLCVGIANEDGSSQYAPFQVCVAGDHAAEHGEVYIANIRDLIDDEIDSHRWWGHHNRDDRSKSSFDADSIAAITRLAERFEAEAAYIRQVLATTPLTNREQRLAEAVAEAEALGNDQA